MKTYIIIQAFLSKHYNNINTLQSVAKKILNIKERKFKCYETLTEAQEVVNQKVVKYKNSAYNLGNLYASSVGIIEINMEKEELSNIRTKMNNPEIIENAIIGVYFNNMYIPRNRLGIANNESEHLKEMQLNTNDIQLSLPYNSPLFYLNLIPNELRFLLLIDYKLFDYKHENWRHYNDREPGCIEDLFMAETYLMQRHLYLSKKPKPFSMSAFTSFHCLLSKSVAKLTIGSGLKEGVFREYSNCFPLDKDAVTKEGIQELLYRIKKDNNLDGFMIGKLHKSKIVYNFINTLEMIIFNAVPVSNGLPANSSLIEVSSSTKTEEIVTYIGKLMPLAIERTYLESIKYFNELTLEQVNDIVCCSLDFEEIVNSIRFGSMFWAYMREHLDSLKYQFLVSPSKAEYLFEIAHARQHALARAGGHANVNIANYSEDGLNELANNIFNLIRHEKVKLYFFAPASSIAQQNGYQAIDDYNENMLLSKTNEEKISCICTLVRELELNHLFSDVNLRTCYFTLNDQLLEHGIKPTSLYNPNRLDAYSAEQFKGQVIEGIYRINYIINQAPILIKKNDSINNQYLNKINSNLNNAFAAPEVKKSKVETTDYQAISYSLHTLLVHNQQLYSEVSTLINKYNNICSSFPETFTLGEPRKVSQMRDALVKLEITNNIDQFFESVVKFEDDNKDVKYYSEINNDIYLLQKSYAQIKPPVSITLITSEQPPAVILSEIKSSIDNQDTRQSSVKLSN